MKNFLEYYYNFLNITVHEKKDYYYFQYNQENYAFVYTNRSISELNAIYQLVGNLKKYHKIVLNKNNSPITFLNNKQYVLLKVNYHKGNINYSDLEVKEVAMSKEMEILLRNNWVDLIGKKIDYLEYQREHLKDKYKVLDESLDYYIGMSENCIAYLNYTLAKSKSTNLDLSVNHKRITCNSKVSFYNPLNIIIDHKSRDVSEYLKYLFIKGTYHISLLREIIINSNLSNYGYQLLYARMLYPSFYFDIYEKIINNKELEKTAEYEEYLNTIYQLINQITRIPSIDWV